MKGKKRILTIVALTFALTMMITIFFSVYNIKRQAEADLDLYKKEHLANVKNELKSNIDMAYSIVETNFENGGNRDYLKRYYGEKLRNMLDIIEGILKENALKVRSGKMTLRKAQSQAREIIRKARYDKVGYFWINSTDLPHSKMIMHPVFPELEGKILDDKKYECALGKGKNLFTAFVEETEKKGEAFVDYIWPKKLENGTMHDVPKLGYVRKFKEWNWIVGTGIYLDDAARDAYEKSIKDLKKLRYADGQGYFWINDSGKPFPKMVMHPISTLLDGVVLSDKKYNRVAKKRANLFVETVKITEKQNSGFLKYYWDKPAAKGVIRDVPKLSYVKSFKPYRWIIGTGVYIDDLDRHMERQSAKINSQIRLTVIQTLFASFLIGAAGLAAIFLFMKYLVERGDPLANQTKGDVTSLEKEASLKYPENSEELVKLMLKEQTRLSAFQKIVESNEQKELNDEVRNLTKEIKNLVKEISKEK